MRRSDRCTRQGERFPMSKQTLSHGVAITSEEEEKATSSDEFLLDLTKNLQRNGDRRRTSGKKFQGFRQSFHRFEIGKIEKQRLNL